MSKPGIFYGYIIILNSFLILMIMWGAQYCFGVFFKPMLKEFGISRAVLSGAYSLNLILVAVASIFSGKLSDRYGPRLVVTVCGSCLGISYLLMSQVQTVWQIYIVFGILSSISIAGSWVPLLSTIARWFVCRRGLMCGLAAAGIGVGTMLFPPLAGFLISSFGWRTSYIIIGLGLLVVVIINAQLLKRDPSQIGLSALGESDQPGDSAGGYTFKEALRTRQFWLLSAVVLVLNGCLQTVFVHIVAHATDIGVLELTAATVISVIGGVSIISKVGGGLAVDRLGNKPVTIMVTSLMCLSMIIIQFSNGLAMLYVFAAIFAFGYGGFAAMQSPYVAELFGLKDHGAILGFTMFIQGVGAFGPFIAGKIFDANSSYRLAFMILAILSFLSILLAIGINKTDRCLPMKKQ
ncbi:MAG: MFS transporter [Deltaproteobacteria bacterium]|nr:MFS transporter [Deltaproteobacteria bacterium]